MAHEGGERVAIVRIVREACDNQKRRHRVPSAPGSVAAAGEAEAGEEGGGSVVGEMEVERFAGVKGEMERGRRAREERSGEHFKGGVVADERGGLSRRGGRHGRSGVEVLLDELVKE